MRPNQRKQSKDPTKTGPTARLWKRDLDGRFGIIKQAITEAIVNKDVFGLREGVLLIQAGQIVIEPRKFQYATAVEQLDGFMSWLNKQVDEQVLEVIERDGPAVAGHSGWQNKYIRACYDKGIKTAYGDLKSIGLKLPETGVGFDLRGYVHAPKVAMLYSRAFNELKGITDTMSQQISRELATGFAQGLNPRDIAKSLNDRVDKIGITRSRLLAQTETAYARNVGAVAEMDYQEHVLGEEIYVQWETAGDWKVRPTHQERRGRVFTKAEAKQLLGEPGCRCNLIPYIKSMQGDFDSKTRLPVDKTEWPRGVIEAVSVGGDAPLVKIDPMKLKSSDFPLPIPFVDNVVIGLAEKRGFIGTPSVISENEMNKLINSGDYIELYRGAKENRLQQFIKGDYRASTGAFGSGIYTGHGPDAKNIAKLYAPGETGKVMRMAIPKSANIAKFEDINELRKKDNTFLDAGHKIRKKAFELESQEMLDLSTNVASIADDAGRYAIALGYDAMIGSADEFIVFNRGILKVQEF